MVPDELAKNTLFNHWAGFLISAVIGAVIYWINISDPKAPASDRDKKVGIVIAALNVLVLYSASFGAHKLISGG